MKVGFTGTRQGMNVSQLEVAFGTIMLFDLQATEFHHGSCKGADVQAAREARKVCGSGLRIIAHPGPEKDDCREHSGVDNEMRPNKNHFARNRDIVNETDLLIASPQDWRDMPRGGTWFTVNYAAKVGKPCWIIWPDGAVERRSPIVAEFSRKEATNDKDLS